MKHIEDNEQALLFETLREFYPYIRQVTFSIPNGGKRDIREAARLKRQGVTPGVPDIFCAHPAGPYHGLFIEMKRPFVKKSNKPSLTSSQVMMISAFRLKGYRVEVCYGFKEALDLIVNYWSGL